MRERKLYERPSNKKARFGRVPIFPVPFARALPGKARFYPHSRPAEEARDLQHGFRGGRVAMEKRDSCPHFPGGQSRHNLVLSQ